MNGYIRAKINYCSYMEKNVVYACKRAVEGELWECLSKFECDYDSCGCRNSLSERAELLTNSEVSANITN